MGPRAGTRLTGDLDSRRSRGFQLQMRFRQPTVSDGAGFTFASQDPQAGGDRSVWSISGHLLSGLAQRVSPVLGYRRK